MSQILHFHDFRLTKKYVNFDQIKIVTYCRYLKKYTKKHNFNEIHKKYTVNKLSKL